MVLESLIEFSNRMKPGSGLSITSSVGFWRQKTWWELKWNKQGVKHHNSFLKTRGDQYMDELIFNTDSSSLTEHAAWISSSLYPSSDISCYIQHFNYDYWLPNKQQKSTDIMTGADRSVDKLLTTLIYSWYHKTVRRSAVTSQWQVMCSLHLKKVHYAPPYIIELLSPYHTGRDMISSDQRLMSVHRSRIKCFGDGAFFIAAP